VCKRTPRALRYHIASLADNQENGQKMNKWTKAQRSHSAKKSNKNRAAPVYAVPENRRFQIRASIPIELGVSAASPSPAYTGREAG
jgi:hypothetical protein